MTAHSTNTTARVTQDIALIQLGNTESKLEASDAGDLSKLPSELIHRIASFDPLPLMRTSKFFKEIVDKPSTWKALLDTFVGTRDLICLSSSASSTDGVWEISPYVPLLVLGTEWNTETGRLLVQVFTPRFFIDAENYTTGDILVERNRVYIKRARDGKYPWLEPGASEEIMTLDWETECKGRVLRPTGESMRNNFDCPECSGERSICPGCGGVSMRWPDHFSGCGIDMPCPCCVGSDIAMEVKKLNRAGDYDRIDAVWGILKKRHGIVKQPRW